MKLLLIAAIFLAAPASLLAEEKEFWCHNVKADIYQPVYPDDKADCDEAGGEFGSFDLRRIKYSCMFTDSFFAYGKSYSETKAKAHCAEKSGTFKNRSKK